MAIVNVFNRKDYSACQQCSQTSIAFEAVIDYLMTKASWLAWGSCDGSALSVFLLGQKVMFWMWFGWQLHAYRHFAGTANIYM